MFTCIIPPPLIFRPEKVQWVSFTPIPLLSSYSSGVSFTWKYSMPQSSISLHWQEFQFKLTFKSGILRPSSTAPGLVHGVLRQRGLQVHAVREPRGQDEEDDGGDHGGGGGGGATVGAVGRERCKYINKLTSWWYVLHRIEKWGRSAVGV